MKPLMRNTEIDQRLIDTGLTRDELNQVPPDTDVVAYFESQSMFPQAVIGLAVALPKVYAVSWIAECARRVDPPEDQEELRVEREAQEIAVRWLKSQDETSRNEARVLANDTRHSYAGSFLCAAIAWSSGSLAAPELPPIRPPEHLTAVATKSALLMLAARKPVTMLQSLQTFIGMARQMFA